MKSAIQQIELALKKLYNLETSHKAENFLVLVPSEVPLKTKPCSGKLLIQQKPSQDELQIGIYLNPPVHQELRNFSHWGPKEQWNTQQLNAFSVATEELSHFHYVVFNSQGKRQISQFELELQGEIDKFLLTYFSPSSQETLTDQFDQIFSRFFSSFYLLPELTQNEKERYQNAITSARNFLKRHRRLLTDPQKKESALRLLRRFYRLSQSEKLSWISI